MAAHPVIMDILRKFLGSEFIMGSIAANRILPGGLGQEPHVDYPYWDFYKPESHPIGLNGSFPMNAQASILLDPFTEETGATAYAPGSQKELRYPMKTINSSTFANVCWGSRAMLPCSTVSHGTARCPTNPRQDRSAVLINYLPKWVKPLEDMPGALSQEFLEAASPDLRQLLGLNYPYPELFDEAKAGNAVGRK